MRLRFFIPVGILMTIFSLVIIVGCSSDNEFINSSPGVSQTSNAYFPTTEGWTNVFEVKSDASGSYTYTLLVDDSVTIQQQKVYEWIGVSSRGYVDTSYVQIGQQSVLLYENGYAAPEQLLKVPLAVGSCWYRYPQVDNPSTDTTSIITSITDNQTDSITFDDDQGGIVSKVIPTEGSNVFTVAAIENLVLSGDRNYSGACKISNDNPDGSKNYYWFVPNVGLVKYVIGATSDDTDGRIQGELIVAEKR